MIRFSINPMLWIFFLIPLIALITAGCENPGAVTEGLPFYDSPDFTPRWLSAESLERTSIHRIPDFTFINQNGDSVTQHHVDGKIYVADFIFTACPGICPKMAGNMSILQTAFRDDSEIVLLSHSVTPESDSVATLRAYADLQGAIDGKWHLLTGNRKAIYKIARTAYFADEDLGFQKNENDFLHTENFILVDHQRHIRGVYNGVMPADMNRLIEDIRLLKNEGKNKKRF